MSEARKKLLIITQKVDQHDAILGFFHTWIQQFSHHFAQVTVICLEKGSVHLPEHVKVFSLGKEEHRSRWQYTRRFFRYVSRERDNYDAVFVHMNPVYVVLGGLFWRLWNKKIYLWYVHRHVDLKLRVAEKFVHKIFTASKESFRLPSKKVEIVGHGIDVEKFLPNMDHMNRSRVLSVGRISKTKNQLFMVEAVQKIAAKNIPIELVLVGSGVTDEEKQYEQKLRQYVVEEKLSMVTFAGDVSPDSIVEEYQSAHVFLNLSSTGSLDKAVLEAMACGLEVLTSNEAFQNIVPEDSFVSQKELSTELLAQKIISLIQKDSDSSLRNFVVEKHNIKNLIPYMSGVMSSS